jgi:GT2 family glycosyltransferase
MSEKVGCAVITCDRPAFYNKCINSIKPGWYDKIITVDDGNIPVTRSSDDIVINSGGKGVGHAKNLAIKCLLDNGCEYIILVEDDMVFTDNLFKAYIAAHKKTGIHHFMFGYHGPANKGGVSGGPPKPRKIIDYGDIKVALNLHCVGAVTFYTRECLENVGLYDEKLVNAFEHVEHSYRLAKAGYSTPYWWWADIPNSLDYVNEQACSEHSSSIRPRQDWQSNIQKAAKVFLEKHGVSPVGVPNLNLTEVLNILKIRKPTEPISFVVHYREDTEERRKNFKIIYNYYKAIYPNCEFVFVEDGPEKTIEHIVRGNDQYIFHKSDAIYNKCIGYNIGLENAINNIVCFLDIDCIVSIDSLSRSIETISNIDNSICIGYNGVAIYAEYKLKKQITGTGSANGNIPKLFEHLQSTVDVSNIRNLYTTDLYTVGNVNAVGGCLIAKRNTFKDINGFNPNFKGWGYEDNEIISRAKILGKTVTSVTSTDSKYFLFHLPHEDSYKVALTDKSNHKFYKHNEQLVQKVERFNKKQMETYIESW